MAKSEQRKVHSDASSLTNETFKSPFSTIPITSISSHSRTMQCPLAPITVLSKSIEDNHGQVNGWLEAMRASSPRYSCLVKEENGQVVLEEEAQVQYKKWAMEHPSALRMFKEITESARGKQVAIFLDYDGTLSPIVDDPDCAYMSDVMRETVKRVAANFPTAIITGRRRDKVYEFVHLAELYYAGSHGMDIMGPAEGCNGFKAEGVRLKDSKGNDVVLFQPASEYLPLMDEVCALLRERTKHYSGARVDHNKYCATLHFRCVREEDWFSLGKEVEAILEQYPALSLTQGRKVLELRPAIEWHKGKALEFLLNSLGLGNPSEVLPVYIGDDRTDEDAFHVLKERGLGCSILVSKVAKETCAAYSLQGPSEVMEFLQHLVKWKVMNLQQYRT